MRKSKPRYDLLALIAVIAFAVPFFGGYATASMVLELSAATSRKSNEPKFQAQLDLNLTYNLLYRRLKTFPECGALLHKINTVNEWAAPANMYPVLFQLTLWFIDTTGAPEHLTMQFFERNLFPALFKVGYPRDPAEAVINAYKWKFG